jgi:hypothetical protein
MLTALFALPIPDAISAVRNSVNPVKVKKALEGLRHTQKIYHLFNVIKSEMEAKQCQLRAGRKMLEQMKTEADQIYTQYFFLRKKAEFPEVETDEMKALLVKYKEKLAAAKSKQECVNRMTNEVEALRKRLFRNYKRLGGPAFLRNLLGPVADKIAVPLVEKLGLGLVAGAGVSGVGLIGAAASKPTASAIPGQPGSVIPSSPSQNQPGSEVHSPSQNQPGSEIHSPSQNQLSSEIHSPSQNQLSSEIPSGPPSSDANELRISGNVLGRSRRIEVNVHTD